MRRILVALLGRRRSAKEVIVVDLVYISSRIFKSLGQVYTLFKIVLCGSRSEDLIHPSHRSNNQERLSQTISNTYIYNNNNEPEISAVGPGLLMVTFTTCRAAAVLRAVILGAPASGKGTVSSRIVQQFGVAHISSGDRLRFHVSTGTDLGREVKRYMDSGSFVPDDTMISLIGGEIESALDRNWLLDGFPRTLTQAERLQTLRPINLVLNLVVPTYVILNRVKSRWVHLPSGRVYNIGFNDPRVPGKDDVTGEPLSQREDDKPEVVMKRLQDYTTKTEPVVRFYREIGILRDFHGNTTDEMWPNIRNCIAQYF